MYKKLEVLAFGPQILWKRLINMLIWKRKITKKQNFLPFKQRPSLLLSPPVLTYRPQRNKNLIHKQYIYISGMHPRNVGSDKIVGTYVRPPLPVSRIEILAFQAPARFGGR